jgi:outer membrane protein assembly factor BamB
MDDASRRQYLRRSLLVGAAMLGGCLAEKTPTEGGATPTETDAGGAREPTPTTSGPVTTTGHDTPTPTDPATPSGEGLEWWVDRGAPVTATPAVADGTVYAGTEDGTVSAHASDTGETTWEHEADEQIQELTVGEGHVLAVSGTTELSAGQKLYALDAATGDERWTFSPTGWWLDLLAVHEGRVYVGTEDDVVGERNETLYAVELEAGEPAWEATTGDPREAVFDDETLYLSTTDRVDAFATDDGTERWHAATPDPTFTTLAVAGGTVVQGFEPEDADVFGLVAGFDADTGEELWRLDDWFVTSTAARDGDLYVGGERVVAVDPVDGTTEWTFEEGGFLTDASADDGRVYAGGDGVAALDRASGEGAWTFAPEPAQGGVRVAGRTDGTLYLDAYHDADPRNQYKFAVDAATGEQRWAFEDGTELTGLAVGDGLAVAGGENGRVYGLS